MHLFYIENCDSKTKEISLSEEESRHACKVLRLKNQDEILILNGEGSSFVAEIIDNHPKKCLLKIKSHQFEGKNSQEIHIAIAPTKNMDRLEWFFEKACELGITDVSLFFSKNSERKQVKIDRLEKILISAMKQSQRKYLPKLQVFDSLDEFFKIYHTGAIAHCFEGEKKSLNQVFKTTNFPILIGPEGDFTQEELEKAIKIGFQPISLGNNRLRTETAGLYACMFAKTILES
jgi:16S rRNA (uracil1498-N3)-methyltransferase